MDLLQYWVLPPLRGGGGGGKGKTIITDPKKPHFGVQKRGNGQLPLKKGGGRFLVGNRVYKGEKSNQRS